MSWMFLLTALAGTWVEDLSVVSAQCAADSAPCDHAQNVVMGPTRAGHSKVIGAVELELGALLLVLNRELDEDRAAALADYAGRMLAADSSGQWNAVWRGMATEHPVPQVRQLLASHTRRAQSKAAVGVAVAAAADVDAGVRQAACRALASHPDQLETLLVLLTDSNTAVREQAVKAIGTTRQAQAADALVGALADSAIRKSALRALSRVDLVRAKAAAQGLMEDVDAQVSAEARRVLAL